MAPRPEHFLEEISVREAAGKYGLTQSQLTKLARAAKIRARKFGRDWILDEASLRMYMAQPRKTGPKPRTQLPPNRHTAGNNSHPSEASQSHIDWMQKIMDDLQHAVDANQLSEDGRRVILLQLNRERQVQDLVRQTASASKPSEK
jgi:hypothetical protein